MSRAEARFLHVANLLVGGTGLLYAWFRYGVAPSDPYTVVNHPLQPLVQHLHVWAAPLLVFAGGLVWRGHAWRHFREGVAVRRRTGLTLLANLAPMVASGYFLQTAVSPAWRQAWVVVHLISGGLWVAGYCGHLLAPRGSGRGQQRHAARLTPAPDPESPTPRASSRNLSA